MENYQLIHGTYGLRRGKSPRQSWRPGKGLLLTFCAGTRSGSPRPSSGSRPLEDALPQLTQRLADSKAARAAHYAQDVLFPKYRTFVLVCSLCELVQSGRRATWKGPQGAHQRWRPSSRRGGSSPTGTKSSARGTVCRPGSSSSALPCRRPPTSPCEALPGLTGGGFFFEIATIWWQYTSRNRQNSSISLRCCSMYFPRIEDLRIDSDKKTV